MLLECQQYAETAPIMVALLLSQPLMLTLRRTTESPQKPGAGVRVSVKLM